MNEKNTKGKLNIPRLVFIVLAVLWMGVIFSFSARDADESTEQSNWVGFLVGRIFVTDFEELPEEDQLAFAEKWEYPIRKTAHMSEYAVLGFLLVGAIGYMRFAFPAAVLYACTDEFHQLFVPGRSGKLTDVGFDSVGALVGILVGYLILKAIQGKEKK